MDIEAAKEELEELMIKGLLEYVKTGTFPNNSPDAYETAYTIVYNMSNLGHLESEALFEYHNKTIQKVIEYCYKIVSNETTTQLIDLFIKQTENINFMIHWMNRIFNYLDKNYTKYNQKGILSQNAINLYKQFFFNPLEEDIYREVNKLIKEDRNCNLDSRSKIKTILNIEYHNMNLRILIQNNL